MEKLFQYVWKHKLFPAQYLRTTTGEEVAILDVGLHNTDAGPDFFNAKIRIGGQLWAGNVELHLKASDWYLHGHEKDKAYDSVILHVVTKADCEARNSRGVVLPTLEIPVPERIKSGYENLLREDKYPRCHRFIPSLSRFVLHSWMSALQAERLGRKADDILSRLENSRGSWEEALFVTLARNFGFGLNSDAFELWARSIPLSAVGHHRDNVFQVEAIFLGQAGLLDPRYLPGRQRENGAGCAEANSGESAPLPSAKKPFDDEYFLRLSAEYKFLAHKFQLEPISGHTWKFLRLRPQNFPYIRLSQLAVLFHNRKAGFSQLIECESVDALAEALQIQVSEYWQTHYLFGEESKKSLKRLSRSSIEVLLINTVIPVLFAYGRYTGNQSLTDRAQSFLEALKAEDNNIVRMWRECSLEVENAGDSQALIQLKKEYCDKKKCLRCRIGFNILKNEAI